MTAATGTRITAAPGKLTSSVGGVYRPPRFAVQQPLGRRPASATGRREGPSPPPDRLAPQVEVTIPTTMRPAVAASGQRLRPSHDTRADTGSSLHRRVPSGHHQPDVGRAAARLSCGADRISAPAGCRACGDVVSRRCRHRRLPLRVLPSGSIVRPSARHHPRAGNAGPARGNATTVPPARVTLSLAAPIRAPMRPRWVPGGGSGRIPAQRAAGGSRACCASPEKLPRMPSEELPPYAADQPG